MLTFEDCTVTGNNEILFQPEWGVFDLPLACKVSSVFAGPADRVSYGEIDDFVAKRVPQPKYSDQELHLFSQYQTLRDLRTHQAFGEKLESGVSLTFKTHLQRYPMDWLFFLEAYELVLARIPTSKLALEIKTHLEKIATAEPKKAGPIKDGLNLCEPSKSM